MATEENKTPLDPYKTVAVVRTPDGKEVGRIPVTAKNATQYIDELARHYGNVNVTYEADDTGGLFSLIFQ